MINNTINENYYCYIGNFLLQSGAIDISDPYYCPMTRAIKKIPRSDANAKMITVHDMLTGPYEAYRIIDPEQGHSTHIVIFHASYTLTDLVAAGEPEFLGYSCTFGSSAVSMVDRRYHYDTRYGYFSVLGEEEEYFDGRILSESLDEMPYDEKKRQQFLELIKNKRKQNSHPTGKEILEIIGDETVWDGFRRFGSHSSHWSSESLLRLHESLTDDILIKGGIVSQTPSGFVPCYCYRNSLGDIYALSLSLGEYLPEETDIFYMEEVLKKAERKCPISKIDSGSSPTPSLKKEGKLILLKR